jgi:hypothetical protein
MRPRGPGDLVEDCRVDRGQARIDGHGAKSRNRCIDVCHIHLHALYEQYASAHMIPHNSVWPA